MTSREYKRMCRIKVTRLSKFITWASLVMFFCLAEFFSFGAYFTALGGITLWLYMPDVAAYWLEKVHKLNHDYVTHR